MRIVHLSDIHAFCPPTGIGPLLDKRLLGTFNHLLRRRRHHDWSRVERAVGRIRLLSPDLVLVTGDLSTVSAPSEFQMALDALQPLIDDHSFELLFVPGNHDYYVKRATCRDALEHAFRTMNRGRWGLDDLPLIHDVGQLRLILLNQSIPAPLWSSHGAISKEAEAWVKAQFARHDFRGNSRIGLVSHFPLYDRGGLELARRRSCRRVDGLQAALTEGKIDVAFCGHIHKPFVRWESAGSVELCAGSLTISGLFNRIEYDLRANRLAHEWIDVDLDTAAAVGATTEATIKAMKESGSVVSMDRHSD